MSGRTLYLGLLSSRLRSMTREAQNATGELVPVLAETIDCHKVIKVYGGLAYEARRFERANQRLRGFNMRYTVPASLTSPVTHILAATALAIIVYIALRESASLHVSVGEFAFFITAMLMLLSPLKRLTEVNAPLQRGLAVAESVSGLIDTPVERDEGTVTLSGARGEVVFEDVRFAYATRNQPALDGVSLAVRPGETVALGGGSGGGKTTLVNLLPRFYAPEAGRVLLDGHDLQGLATLIGVVVERGRVAETGTHAELLAREGAHARLDHMQFLEPQAK